MAKKQILESNIITLRSVYDKANIKYVIQPCRNKLGAMPSCVKPVDSHGDMRLSTKEQDDYAEGKAAFYPENHFFTIYSGQTFDLNDIWEAAAWEAVKNCPLIAPDRDAKDAQGNLLIDGPKGRGVHAGRNGVAELYVDRPGLDTQRNVSKRQLIHNAETYIFDDTEDGQRKMARVLGRNMSNQIIADVLDFLLGIAKNNPQKIISLYTGGDTELRILLIDAREKNVIAYKNKLYIYNDSVILGGTDDAAIEWMKNPKNAKTLTLIKQDTYPEYYADSEQ